MAGVALHRLLLLYRVVVGTFAFSESDPMKGGFERLHRFAVVTRSA
jgi:hypothetical protein